MITVARMPAVTGMVMARVMVVTTVAFVISVALVSTVALMVAVLWTAVMRLVTTVPVMAFRLGMVVVAGVRVGLRGVVVVVLGHDRSVPPGRMLLVQEAGCISLSTTHLWFVISMPSAS